MSQNIWGFPSNQSTTIAEALGYKKYVALLTQSGTDAPVATVLENTIGDIVWTRVSIGVYAGTLAGSFTQNKTIIPPFDPVGYTYLPIYNNSVADNYYSFYCSSIDEVRLLIIDSTGGDVELSSITDLSLLIEIRVYP
jgi:hypothetical protein